MQERGKRCLRAGCLLIGLFAVWTVLIQTVDVRCAGEMGTEVGFAALNVWFHDLCGVHMLLYGITDWLGLVPVCICMGFGVLGLMQMIRRRSLRRVDADLIFLGVYYLLVVMGYLLFEMAPVNFRPILIEGRLEASYPSSTTLLALSVMPTMVFQLRRRLRNIRIQTLVSVLARGFSFFMVIGRLISGVHWCTDIVGAVLLGKGMFCMYEALVVLYEEKE